MSTLRTRTAKNKAVFYRLRNDLLSSLEDDDVEIRVVRSDLSKLSMVFEDLIENYSQLEERYKVYAEVDKLAKLDVDLERIEGDFAEIEELANARLRSARTLTSRIREQEQEIEMLTADIEKTILEYQNKIQNKDNIVQHQEIENTNAVNSGNPLECEADVTPHDAEASEQVAEHKIEESEPVSDQHEHQPTQPTMCTPQMMSTPINGSGKNSVNRPTDGNLPNSTQDENLPKEIPDDNCPQESPDNSNNRTSSMPTNSRREPIPMESLPVPIETQPVKNPSNRNVQSVFEVSASCNHGNIQTPIIENQTTINAPQKACWTQSQLSCDNPSPGIKFDLPVSADHLLTRVSIPKFSGNKRLYEGWKAAFYACVDKSNTTPEYKLLRLRDCLQGEALKVVENLGHTPAAYEAAKSRLDRKYGGTRRALTLRLEELNSFKPIREGNERDLENLAELLDVVVVNLKDAGQDSELGSGSLYITIMKKLNKSLLARYNQWIADCRHTESVEKLREFIDRESQFLTTASETLSGIAKEPARRDRHATGRTLVTQSSEASTDSKVKCKVCSGAHGVWACDKFKGMTIKKRWYIAKENRLCFRCLSSFHHGKDCPRSKTCDVDGCTRSHHRLLHDSNVGPKQETQSSTSQAENVAPHEGEKTARTHTATGVNESSSQECIALRTVPVIIRNGEKSLRVNALLDDGSTTSYINRDVAAQLNIDGPKTSLTVNVLNDCKSNIFDSSLVDFQIESVDGKTTRPLSAYTTNRVTGSMPVVNWSKQREKWQHLEHISFPKVGKRPIVDLLIGVDQADLHCALEETTGEPGEPIARLTPLGWTCIGYPNYVQPQTNVTFTQHHDTELTNLVRRFWEIDEPSPTDFVKPEEKRAIDVASQSLNYTSNGHFCVGIPWKTEKPKLPHNYNMALKRLENTEKKLLRDPAVCKSYKDVINGYLEKGYIEKIQHPEDGKDQVWYLPHFPVLRPDKSTTKTRIVFDASAKVDGVALNDIIHQGPKLQNDLFAVLLRFRRNPVAVMCDIAEMYLQIEMKPEDRPLHRFLWRDVDQAKEPDVYQFNRIVFGVNSSPFLAQFVSQRNAENNKAKYPLAAETVLHSTYMDDSMDSVEDVETAIKLRNELVELWNVAGMRARKWLSNSPDVLRGLPPEECATSVDLDSGQLPSTKTLGIMWHPESDMFTFSSNQQAPVKITKRSFLSGTASLFDPLGMLTPFTIRAKIIFQKMWMAGLEWDTPIEGEIANEATSWFEELPQLEMVQVPRYLSTTGNMKGTMTLHTFADASLEAYGAVVYARVEFPDGTVTSNLVASKARVAPLQAVSVPRLELMAAVVGLRLTQNVAETLEVDRSRWRLWSDSMDVLYWVRGCSRHFKPFVANRVGEIQAATDPEQWTYVPTKLNPADLLSRGLSVTDLAGDTKWWNGPEYLCQPPEDWPVNKVDKPQLPSPEVKKQYHETCHFQSDQVKPQDKVLSDGTNMLQPNRFSSWSKLVRLTARVMRFVYNCCNPKELRQAGRCLLPEELKDAEIHHIKQAQAECFSEEIKALKKGKPLPKASKLLSLNPFIDDEGVLRSSSRLEYSSSLPWESKYPIILPRKHVVTSLIIQDMHVNCLHGGTNLVLSHLSTKYWILSAREAIRDSEKKCAFCQKKKATPAGQVMAPLPEVRTRLSLRAFNQASVDYAGPFYTKQGRGKSRLKRYLCLFTCLSTRAVHLEMAFSLDTDSFLNAFYRFTSRRGLPSLMISDNGTNFVSADRELRELRDALDVDKIQDSTAVKGVKWQFNPPGAPHFNGVHEIMIKAAKKAMKSILGDADVNDEELMSAIVGAEGLINSRPLTYQSSNASDDQPLTPNHFLHGQIGGQFAPETVDTTAYNLKKRWRRVQELVRHFWRRWLREWLPGLSPRGKWKQPHEDLKQGDIVLVVSPDTPRGKWPLGRVTKTFPGADGHVRAVDVQVGKTTLRRPVVKLCPIERNN